MENIKFDKLSRRNKFFLLALLGIVITGIIMVVPDFLKLVVILGKRIPQVDIRLDYIKGVLWAIFLGLTIIFWPIQAQDKKILLLIWVIKCFVMLVLMLFYEYHYPLDCFGYFDAGLKNIGEWKVSGIIQSNAIVVFITWMHQHSFVNSYHAAKVSFGMIGLIGVYIFYRSAVNFSKQENQSFLYILGLFPSILFWSSILGKEPLVLFCISIYCYGFIKKSRTGSLFYIFIMLIGLMLAILMRPWLGFILGAPALIMELPRINLKNIKAKVVLLIILAILTLVPTETALVRFGLKAPSDYLHVINEKFSGFSIGGSAIDKTLSDPLPKETVIPAYSSASEKEYIRYKSLKDVVIFIPRGVFTALFRPLPGEVRNAFGFIAGLEGAFMLILFILAIIRMRWRRLLDPVCIWAILFIFIWAVSYSFVSFNLGTVCRYRLQILPIFLGLLLYLVKKSAMVIHK